MNRREFSSLITKQFQFIESKLPPEYYPVWDYLKRGEADQKMLFDQKRSECDGINKISRHQLGKAADILIMKITPGERDKVIDPMVEIPDIWRRIRVVWEESGGDRMIPWDKNHFE